MADIPRGFWSYARGDDEHLDRRLSDLRTRVAGEISILLGRDLDMFQDVHDIRTGDDWRERLRAALTGASFMVPVLTPRYFERDWCREELLAFLRLQSGSGRTPLLFPIYFVEDLEFDQCNKYNEEELKNAPHCEVRKAVSRHQYLDFRELRFESDPTRVERAIHQFAKLIRDNLRNEAGVRPTASPRPPPRPEPLWPAAVVEPRPVPKATEIPTLVVDPWPGRGDLTTIQGAIDAAPEGGRILIRPGLYDETVTLEKALELLGDGPREDIVLRASTGAVMVVTANIARVAGLTLRRDPGGGDGVALGVSAGRAEFEDCAFVSKLGTCTAIEGAGTAPVFRRCRFHDGANLGLIFRQSARGLVEDCEITGTTFAGVLIGTGADPILRRCVIRGSQWIGAYAVTEGGGTFEDCEIADCARAGVAVTEGGHPTLRNCRIFGHSDEVILIEDAESGGTFEGNDLRGNRKGAWHIAEGAEANVVRRGNIED